MRLLISLLAGGLFGLGLMVSGMTDVTKVQGWLDVFGAWDPTLAFVLGGAIAPMAVAWRLTTRHSSAVLGAPFPPKPSITIDRSLILGAVLFGTGWALVGFCPGPAMASLSYGGAQGLAFFAAMIAGMVALGLLRRRAQ
ncbi:DUF6691 family protein [Aquicoccus sp. G2-2]|uniref:DUF6691 family protein n=1 Tax=Aquicoccus sp. G2-2 TaxID=3092120 RepID=UPI002ADFF954|nr:DUF6691 family protein [Aquicoccus sp. G2-2]MEA1115163.1 DUF6691 family protein [Aquicoccus sp. G2-2]